MKFKSVTEGNIIQSSITIDVNNEPQVLAFKFNMNAYTPKLEAARATISAETELAGPMIIGILMPVLTWWDFDDEDGKNLPVTEEALMSLPFSVLSDLLTKVNEELEPGKKNKTASGGSFSAPV